MINTISLGRSYPGVTEIEPPIAIALVIAFGLVQFPIQLCIARGRITTEHLKVGLLNGILGYLLGVVTCLALGVVAIFLVGILTWIGVIQKPTSLISAPVLWAGLLIHIASQLAPNLPIVTGLIRRRLKGR